MIIVFYISLFVLFYIYIGYPVLLKIWSVVFNNEHMVDENYQPNVSLIIPAYNEEECIEAKLDNALSLEYPKEKLQIIVSSDNSSDRTAEIVKKYIIEHQNGINILFNDFKKRSGKMGVLNKSVSKATGEILIFTDANAMYDAKAIHKMARHFADSQVGCVCGAKIITHGKSQTAGGEGIYWKIEAKIKKWESKISSCVGADGAAYAIRKNLYPYPNDEMLVMDDFVVSLSIIDKGYRCIFDPEIKAFEDSSVDILDEFRRKGRILAGALNVIIQLKRLLLPYKYKFFIQLWSHKILRWMTFVFLLLLFISNVFLADLLYFKWILFLQSLFYIMSVIGFGCSVYNIKSKWFYIPFYFNFMALSQMFGIIQLYNNAHKPAWEKLRR